MLKAMNRTAVIITPKQAFYDMIAALMGEEPEKEMATLSEDESTIYLVEDPGLYEMTIKERLTPCYKDIFYEEVAGWFTDKTKWPKSISWKEFKNYFHISFQSLVFDTFDGEIEYEQ